MVRDAGWLGSLGFEPDMLRIRKRQYQRENTGLSWTSMESSAAWAVRQTVVTTPWPKASLPRWSGNWSKRATGTPT